MKILLKKVIPYSLLIKKRSIAEKYKLKKISKIESKRFIKYGFGTESNINSYEQLEARITKAYHSIEKGLSNQKLRLGFGVDVLKNLINLMEIYREKGYPLKSNCYKSALSNLNEYINIHEQSDFDVSDLKKKVSTLGTNTSNDGGVLTLNKSEIIENLKRDFRDFSLSRHSVRNFSKEPVDIETINKAIQLAQNTPSACNRQGWKIRIIKDPIVKKIIEKNQNGNRGFGSNIDKFLLITTDSQYFAKPRERNQPYIDGGLYAMNLLYSLHYYGIATVPLSASLTLDQESNIRQAVNLLDSENFIMFIGIGNYIDSFKVPKSKRHKPNVTVI